MVECSRARRAAGRLLDWQQRLGNMKHTRSHACHDRPVQSGAQPRQGFGGKPAGEDEAAGLWASWAATRHAASQPELPPQFAMRQALFASQARLLFKLHRHAEVAERGLAFVHGFGGILAQQQAAGGVPPQLREAWSFASCLSLAAAASRLQAARAEERRKTDHLGRGGGRCEAVCSVEGRTLESKHQASPACLLLCLLPAC